MGRYEIHRNYYYYYYCYYYYLPECVEKCTHKPQLKHLLRFRGGNFVESKIAYEIPVPPHVVAGASVAHVYFCIYFLRPG
jgi:hypothetical protein